MSAMVTIRIPAADYVDHDDCLSAAEATIAAERGLEGWDLNARWADDQRDEILLDVPAESWVIEGRGEGGRWSREYVEAGGDAEFDTEAEAEAAIGDLVRIGFAPADLRVRQA